MTRGSNRSDKELITAGWSRPVTRAGACGMKLGPGEAAGLAFDILPTWSLALRLGATSHMCGTLSETVSPNKAAAIRGGIYRKTKYSLRNN